MDINNSKLLIEVLPVYRESHPLYVEKRICGTQFSAGCTKLMIANHGEYRQLKPLLDFGLLSRDGGRPLEFQVLCSLEGSAVL